jgi:hypothetical protein
MCASPGMATAGPADTHCALPDGGSMAAATNPASCNPDVGAPDVATSDASSDATVDSGGATCDYGPTLFGTESDDDDCKYHVKWSSTPICQGTPGVIFTVTLTNKIDGSKATGANPGAEVFTTSPGDWDSASFCDTNGTPSVPPAGVSSTGYWPLAEGAAGTYSGHVVFTQSGQWTVRFHFHHDCIDGPDSPHGHAAYHITVP